MEVTLVIKSILGLVVVLGLLLVLLLSSKKKKKSVVLKKQLKDTPQSSDIKTDLPTLLKIIKDKKSSAEELKVALDLVLKHHGVVHKKLGLRAHPDFDIYMDILFTICRHPHTNKNLIVNFDSALEKLNPEYKKEINDSITKGLNSRGI